MDELQVCRLHFNKTYPIKLREEHRRWKERWGREAGPGRPQTTVPPDGSSTGPAGSSREYCGGDLGVIAPPAQSLARGHPERWEWTGELGGLLGAHSWGPRANPAPCPGPDPHSSQPVASSVPTCHTTVMPPLRRGSMVTPPTGTAVHSVLRTFLGSSQASPAQPPRLSVKHLVSSYCFLAPFLTPG